MLPRTAPTTAGLTLAAERLAALSACIRAALGPTPCRAADRDGERRRNRHHHLCEEAGRQHCTHLGGGWRLYTYAAAHRRVGGPPTIEARLCWNQSPGYLPDDPHGDYKLPIPPDATAAQMAALWNGYLQTEAAKAAATFAALVIPTQEPTP